MARRVANQARKSTPMKIRMQKRAPATGSSTRTRSFPCPDDLWEAVAHFAAERDLGSPAAAARLLLRSGLGVERQGRAVQAARDWQIEQAWAEVQAIEAGDRTFGSWEEIDQAAERARSQIRKREASASRRAVSRA